MSSSKHRRQSRGRKIVVPPPSSSSDTDSDRSTRPATVDPEQDRKNREYYARLIAERRQDWDARKAVQQQRAKSPDPVDRTFRREIVPLRSKPAPRRTLKDQGEHAPRPKKRKVSLGPKPVSFRPNVEYEENGWFVCGFCNKFAESSKTYNDHQKSSGHRRSKRLVKVPSNLACPCGRSFQNKTHAFRHIANCAQGKHVLE